jgi:hypothetical protein
MPQVTKKSHYKNVLTDKEFITNIFQTVEHINIYQRPYRCVSQCRLDGAP